MDHKLGWLILLVGFSPGFFPTAARADDTRPFDQKVDVVYGRKHGMALTMDVFTPKANANGAAIVWVVSGGWFSNHDAINTGPIDELLKRGYTVFAVVHGSQPRFTIPEVVKDMNRAFASSGSTPRTITSIRTGSELREDQPAGTCRSCRGQPAIPETKCQGSRRPDFKPGSSGCLLLPPDGLSQLW